MDNNLYLPWPLPRLNTGGGNRSVQALKILLGLFALFGLLLENTAATVAADKSQPKPVLSLTSLEAPPFISNDLNGKGPIAILVQEAFRRSGYQSKVTIGIWARTISGAESVFFDVLIIGIKAPEREEIFHYSAPYMKLEMALFKKKSLILDWKSLKDLAPYHFTAVRGATVSKEFQAAKYLSVLWVKDAKSMVQLVIKGRANLAASPKRSTQNILEKYFPAEVHNFDFDITPLSTPTVHILVSKKHPNAKNLIDAFNSGLKSMRQDGTYQTMVERYGLFAVSGE
ncbi:MAG: transporter substrate-binding domain-containing protein [Kordiimonadaceae bacterium]|uniref:Solute-binding protein family 3/N-terminal domain-containing protein n=1 Tax=SAR86 cluster bacterium TaxID=2030880 RepID=A0A2A4WVB3_9GAMM|nr:transporter substrate-binding domain-containing protein [Kordiimonadaceae bacterium]PCI73775.1 MAG: hypothetical protein COB20_15870 [SAR86 cluster bacterium]